MSNFISEKLSKNVYQMRFKTWFGLVLMGWSVLVSAYDITDPWKVSINQLGPIQIGIDVKTLRSLVGELEQQMGDGEGCAYYSRLNGEKEVSFMMFEGRLVRIDVYSRKIETISGLRVGDSAERIKDLYSDSISAISPVENDNEELLYLVSAKPEYKNYRLVFEADNGIVTNYRLGLVPYVKWMDGCAGERVS